MWIIAALGCGEPSPPGGLFIRSMPEITAVKIPVGEAMLGSPDDEVGRGPEERQRPVKLTRDLLVMTTEVTQGAYEGVIGVNPMRAAMQRWGGGAKGGCRVLRGESQVAPDFPVACVTWYDAVVFANALSELAGLKPVYVIDETQVIWDRAGDGWRLPTESEWEWVARQSGAGSWGRGAAADAICGFANIADTTLEAVLPEVDSSPCTDGVAGLRSVTAGVPDRNGIVDLTGNVWEWTWDVYAPEPPTGVDPTGPLSGDGRVFRGGGWDTELVNARLARRPGALPTNRAQWLGVRLVRYAP
ncbi:MAG: SUMF1/EgtB/PvdO family nonheme iron enzyme [Deltaproteobacteria bacterium]|nr:SUMF1/EgtB/PvdO family nonheme iron enzyme [Deltaproteobacteria bacterium]